MAKISNPFPGNAPVAPAIPGVPPRFTPGVTSPLADNVARQREARGVNVTPVEEQRRAERIPAEIASGQRAPRFGDAVTRPPFTPTTAVPVNANPAPKAGGSKTR